MGMASLTMNVSDEPPCERKHKLLLPSSSLMADDGLMVVVVVMMMLPLLIVVDVKLWGTSGEANDLPRRRDTVGGLVVVVVDVVGRGNTGRIIDRGSSLAPLTRFTR